jgi:predicted SprT family Zn-dependent metalloprotease
MNTNDKMLYEVDDNGKRVMYRCSCGCNVFKRAEEKDDNDFIAYRCNGCLSILYAEPFDEK